MFMISADSRVFYPDIISLTGRTTFLRSDVYIRSSMWSIRAMLAAVPAEKLADVFRERINMICG